MRHLATICKIEEVQPIENADSIEKVRVKEWWVVAQKGTFMPGSKCIYFEIDSFLPLLPQFDFLLKGTKPKKMLVDGKEIEGLRLKTVRLRGQISQGLVIPLSEFFDTDMEIGEDVSENLNILKWEPPIPANLSGVMKGFFPGFIPKTDEERIQNCSDLLEKHKGEIFYITEKLDGCLFEETLLETEKGLRTIKDVCEDKTINKVLVFDFNTNMMSLSKIKNKFVKKNKKDWYEIELENRYKIKLTGDHLIWCSDLKCYRKVKDLTGNEELLVNTEK